MCKTVRNTQQRKKKESTMVENVINSRSITTIPNQTILGDTSSSNQFYGQRRSPWTNTINKFGCMVYEKTEHGF